MSEGISLILSLIPGIIELKKVTLTDEAKALGWTAGCDGVTI